MKKFATQAALLLAGALSLSTPAMALELVGEVGKFALTTIDLTPGDGIAAGVRIKSYNTTLNSYFGKGLYGVENQTQLLSASSGNLRLTHDDLYASLSYGRQANGLGGFSFEFYDFGDSLSDGELASLGVNYEVRLTVAANSAVNLSGNYRHGAAQSSDFTTQGSVRALLTGAGQESRWGVTTRESSSRPFAFGYVNNTGSDVDILFQFESRFSMQGSPDVAQISPVPEPSTWMMLGGGMALLGMLARRRTPSTRA